MTESDIAGIEKELRLQLSSEYVALLRSYPFAEGSYVAENLLWNDAALLIESNKDLDSISSQASPNVAPQAHLFQIGFDGGEEIYMLDLGQPVSPIYVYDHELGSITEKSSNLESWLVECRGVEAEVEADEVTVAERSANKRWWEFWK